MGCCDTPGLMPVEDAKLHILQKVKAIKDVELCSLEDCVDRILACDLESPTNVPPYDNSAMDGFAIKHSDADKYGSLKLIGKSMAGHPFKGKVSDGQCVRIMTGAKIPDGADTVVMQENTNVNGDRVNVLAYPHIGSAIRKKGEDCQLGHRVMSKGRQLTPADIGQLASLGMGDVKVFRKLKVAVLSTGDELTEPGDRICDGNMFDSNRPALISMLNKLPVDVLDLGIIRDEKSKLREAFSFANQHADIVITSGGVSVGEADYTKDVLDELGNIHFWKLAIKPGKPLAFGNLSESIFFGLPGNPVSALVTFHQIALPTILRMAGKEPTQTLRLSANAVTSFKKSKGRTDYQRGICWTDDNGNLQVKPAGSQGSGILSSLTQGNCYVILEQNRQTVASGERVNVQLFDNHLVS